VTVLNEQLIVLI